MGKSRKKQKKHNYTLTGEFLGPNVFVVQGDDGKVRSHPFSLVLSSCVPLTLTVVAYRNLRAKRSTFMRNRIKNGFEKSFEI
jgi:hypothetical protein